MSTFNRSYSGLADAGKPLGTNEEVGVVEDKPVDKPVVKTEENGTNDEVEEKAYLSDWNDGKSFADHAKASDHSIAELVADYNRWADDNKKKSLDIMEYWPLMNSYDYNKSVKASEKDERRRQMEDFWHQTGYLLTNIGNFVGALNGAPTPSNTADPVELTKRQQLLRDKTLEQRRAYNKDFLAQLYASRKNDADIGLLAARADAVEQEAKNKSDIAAATVGKINTQAGLYNSQSGYYDSKKNEVDALTPLKKENQRSVINRNNRSGSGRGSSGSSGNRSNTYDDFVQNSRKYKDDWEQYKSDNGIYPYSRDELTPGRQPNSTDYQLFNAMIKQKYGSSGNGGGQGTIIRSPWMTNQ